MTNTRSRARLGLLGLALLVVALLSAACAGGGAPAPTQAPQAGTPTAPSTQPQATQPPAQGGAPLDLPVGVDANGNFYRGDANAPVTMEEWSDYQ